MGVQCFVAKQIASQSSQNVVLHLSTEYSSNSFLVYARGLKQTVHGQQCSFWRKVCPCSSAMNTIGVQHSPDGGLINININHFKRSL